MMAMMNETATYLVPDMHCVHCVAAITRELERLDGVDAVEVDLERTLVVVRGAGLDDPTLVSAIDEAGYDAERVDG
jgi:copper chaperone